MRREELYEDAYTISGRFTFPTPMTPETFSAWIEEQYNSGATGLTGSCERLSMAADGLSCDVLFHRSFEEDAEAIEENFRGHTLKQGSTMQLLHELNHCQPRYPFTAIETTLRPKQRAQGS